MDRRRRHTPHLPLLLKPVGNGKLSKRDGDKMGFPVFPLQWTAPDGAVSHGYREDGYFPDAFVNLLAMLGWNPGTEQELFSMPELIEAFSLESRILAGSVVDKFNAGGVTTAAQSYEEKDFSNTTSFSHEWE